ncbi:MAG TPA: DUF4249 domain-containing protein [Crocinitomix sp.]|nr:DUF4249 domain-containing protein [Crocinitomix sp.]
MKRKLYLIIPIIVLLLACEKEIIIDQGEYAPKVTLNCLLNPISDTIELTLSESRDMLYDKSTFPPITGANVTITDNGVNIGAFTELPDGKYILPYTVIPNHTYSIQVTNTKFNDVKATTIVPSPASLMAFNVELGSVENNLKANISVIFQDEANVNNYYGFSFERIDTNKYESPPSYPGYEYHPPYPNRYFCSSDINIEYPEKDIEGDVCSDLILLTDLSFDGQQYQFNCSNSYYIYYNGNQNYDDTTFYTKIKLFLKTYNYDYYLYSLSLNLFKYNYGNPFAEPVRIYSNIEGGYGIFGSLNVAVDSIEFN